MTTTATPAPALCATLLPTEGDLWFSKDPADRTRAKAICRRCPIREACAQAGLDRSDARGIWGGLGSGDRRTHRIGKPNNPVKIPRRLPCGSQAAYMGHRLRGETCDACQPAHDAWVEARRRDALDRHHTNGGTASGRKLHAALGEPPCDACLTAARTDKAASRERVTAAREAHQAHHGVASAV